MSGLTYIVVRHKLSVTMMDASTARAEILETSGNTAPGNVETMLHRLRQETRRWARREWPCLPTGLPWLDSLVGGGWLLGKVSELVGPSSTGRTALAAATVAAATARGEVVAWVDVTDCLDPRSLADAGVDLSRVLWVRPRGTEAAVRAAELVLEAGGFTVVVVDLDNNADIGRWVPEAGGATSRVAASGRVESVGEEGDSEGDVLRRPTLTAALPTPRGGRRGALVLRLVRAVERARGVGIVLAERAWIGAHAAVTLHLGRATPCWRGGAVRWLDGLTVHPETLPITAHAAANESRTPAPGPRPSTGLLQANSSPGR